MRIAIGAGTFFTFLLALIRAAAWISVMPPFNSRAVPTMAKVAVAVALAIASTPLVQAVPADFSTVGFLFAALQQALIGLAMGFAGMLLFSAFSTAGSLVDVFGGFALAQAYDPLDNQQSSVFARFYQLLAVTLLFATNGHLLITRAFVESFAIVPAGGVDFGGVAAVLTEDLSRMFLLAVEIAGPILGAMFLTEMAFGMLVRAAPTMNILIVGFPVKIFITFSLLGIALPLVLGHLEGVVAAVVASMGQVARFLSG